ncbi:hypothetical protein [Alcanivorax sp.]|jgi:hypothetical protein|uniref:hypothetical protein n=1 Tax=Alcanivorax sp. TaxID=1872427 RepID=UPI0032D9209D
MRGWRNILVAGLLALVVGCAAKSYEITGPEKRYQAMVNAVWGKKSEGWVKPKDRWSDTFSVLAPEGVWSFWGPYGWGGIIFRGGPEGIAGRYVGYESRFSIDEYDVAEDALELEALKTGDYDAYIEKAIKRTIGKHDKKQEGYSDGKGGKHPRIPDEFSISMIRVQEMNCRLYQSSNHQYVWSQELGTEGPGAEEYSVGISCPGFFKDDFVSFGCGNTIRISNMHKMHGVDIDHEAIVQDLKKRIQRSLDSVQFDGDFTQVVPEKYR